MAVYSEVLTGKTIRMRAMEESDAEVTFKMRNDPEKTRFLNPPPESVEAQRIYIAKQRESVDGYYFIIEDLEGNPIGMKALSDYCPETKTVESGRFIGFGSQIQHIEALIMGFDFAFDVLGVDKVLMTVIENNKAMYSLQQRLGAKETKRVFMPAFGCNSIHSELNRNDYLEARKKAENIIERFSGRK